MFILNTARLSIGLSSFRKVPWSSQVWTATKTQNKLKPLSIKLELFSSKKGKQENNMVDPKHVVSYEDMLKVIHQPGKVIIDVRNPDEVRTTGKIPSSINIPLDHIRDALISSELDFQKQYRRKKPSSTSELIFYCKSGRRSTEALDKALKLGYTNSKTYLGSWNDWSSRNK